MVDINLQLMLTGKLNKPTSDVIKKKEKGSRFDLTFDKMIDGFITELSLFNPEDQNPLIPKNIRHDKLKEELREKARFLNFDIQLNEAFKLLNNKNECQNYMSVQEYEALVVQFSKIPYYLKKIDLKQLLKNNLYTIFHISDSTMQAIYKMGLAKYNDKEYEASFNIFALLTSLDQKSEGYWYRLAIVADRIGKLDLALQVFAYTLHLNPLLLGARVFSAECYLKLDKIEDARAELEEAKKIIAQIPPEQYWLDLLSKIEDDIKRYHYEHKLP